MKKEPHKKVYMLLRTILMPIFKIYYRPKIYNKEVIPKEGPIIVVANHLHVLDQSFAIISTKRMLHYMAKKEYFDGKHAWFFKATGCISVNRQIHDNDAKNAALDVLNNGWALGLFPEGTRNKTDKPLLPFKMGAVSMAQKTGATIVPFAIKGHYKFWKNDLEITFLEPFKVGANDDLEKANEHLHNLILDAITKEKESK